MGVSAVVAVVGLAVSAGSAVMQYSSSQKAAKAQQESIAAQQKAEALRQKQMELDSLRRKRQLIRQSIQARSMSVANATAQGAGNGSGLQGGLAGITNQLAEGILGVNQNTEIGEGLFAANRDRLTAEGNMNSAKSQAAMWGGLSTLGGALIKNSGTIGTISTNVFGSKSYGSGANTGKAL